MLHAVWPSASVARGRVTVARCRRGEGPSGRRRGDDAREPAAPGAGSGRQDEPLHVPARPPAERPRALRQPADRGRDRARRWKPRRKAPRCSRRATRTEPARTSLGVRRKLRAARRGRRQPADTLEGRRRGRAGEAPRDGSRRPTRRRPSITTPWSRTRSWRRGTATRCPSTRRARASPWRRGGSPACSASRPRTS